MKFNPFLFMKVCLYLIVIFLPLINGFVIGNKVCNVGESSGETVKFRPPASAFGIAWAILYLCIGLSWFFAIYLPNDIKIGGNLWLSNTGIEDLPKNLKINGDISLNNTPLAKKYDNNPNEIRKVYPNIKGKIFI